MGVCFLVVVFAYVSSIGLRNLFRYNSFKLELEQKLVEQELLQQEHDYYLQSLALMDSDRYWELQAKKMLGYVKNGEHIYKYYKQGVGN